MKRIDVSALEIYRNRIFKILILFIPIVALLAGVTFTALKLAGQYPTVSMSALFAFDFSCLLYFCVGLGFVRYCEDAQGNLSPKAVLAGKIFLFLVEGIQWNFITYMIPSRDFWGYAVFFVLLTVFFLDHRFVAFVEAEIGVSLLLSWWLRPEELLPVHDAYFVPEIVLRLVLLFLSFFCLWSLTRTIQKSLVAELENIADFDTLTMLYNRRRGSLPRDLQRAERGSEVNNRRGGLRFPCPQPRRDRALCRCRPVLRKKPREKPSGDLKGYAMNTNRRSLNTLCAALSACIGVQAPAKAAHADEELVSYVTEQIGHPVDRLFLYNPDAIGEWIYRKYEKLFAEAKALAPLEQSFATVMPSVTPVCFATMYTGADPEVHGIRTYAKPVLTMDTFFDACVRAGKKVAILGDAECSMMHIFNDRPIDYFPCDTIAQINALTARLIEEDKHDVIVCYNGNYDSVMHKTGPESVYALAEARANVLAFAAFIEQIRQSWKTHDTLFGFAMDHGCHLIDGGCGSHGLDMPEDIDICHLYGVLSKEI